MAKYWSNWICSGVCIVSWRRRHCALAVQCNAVDVSNVCIARVANGKYARANYRHTARGWPFYLRLRSLVPDKLLFCQRARPGVVRALCASQGVIFAHPARVQQRPSHPRFALSNLNINVWCVYVYAPRVSECCVQCANHYFASESAERSGCIFSSWAAGAYLMCEGIEPGPPTPHITMATPSLYTAYCDVSLPHDFCTQKHQTMLIRPQLHENIFALVFKVSSQLLRKFIALNVDFF